METSTPAGKAFYGVGQYSTMEYTFGDKSSNYDFSYSKFYYDLNRQIKKVDEKRGYFKFANNVISCKFSDGEVRNLEYKNENGEWTVVDGNDVLIFDDPSKRNR